MRKIPTVFRRDPEDMKRVLPEVNPGCEWVLDGEGTATRKYDGTCVMLDDDFNWWARREVKPGKTPPPNFQPVEADPNTGKTMGWEPIEQSGYAKWHADAAIPDPLRPGTYELCGPKVQGNPEGYDGHRLIEHATAEPLTVIDDTFEGIRETAVMLEDIDGIEGIVWHHPDGRMAKIKGRDFPRVRV